MTSPVDDNRTTGFPEIHEQRSSEDESTVGEEPSRTDTTDHVTKKTTRTTFDTQTDRGDPLRALHSPSKSREQQTRIMDQVDFARIERQITTDSDGPDKPHKSVSYDSVKEKRSLQRERSRRDDVDEFDENTTPVHEIAAVYRPPAQPSTKFSKFMKAVHESSWLIRYVVYIAPPSLIILIPLLIGALLPKARDRDTNVGGVSLYWFCIWLEIVWLTLWLGRVSLTYIYCIMCTDSTAYCKMSTGPSWANRKLICG